MTTANRKQGIAPYLERNAVFFILFRAELFLKTRFRNYLFASFPIIFSKIAINVYTIVLLEKQLECGECNGQHQQRATFERILCVKISSFISSIGNKGKFVASLP